MREQKFYVCAHCGQIVAKVEDRGIPVKCCGESMQEIVPGTVDAAREKHIPVWSQDGNVVTVNVGSVTHPMTDEHHIAWVYVLTEEGGQRKILEHTASPVLHFALTDGDAVIAVYAYCNLHGLWKA